MDNHYFDRQATDYNARSESWPWSWLRGRERALVRKFLEAEKPIKSALDLGCGAGFYTRLLLELGAEEVLAVDSSEAMLAHLPRDRVTAWLGDAASEDIEGRFYCIVCAGLLEFVPHPELVLSNARRLATSTSSLVLLLPEAKLQGRLYRLFHRRHGLKISLFDRSDIETLFQKTGWKRKETARVWPFTLVVKLQPHPK